MAEKYMSVENLRLRYEQLITNPVARVPICIVIAADETLRGTAAVQLQKGLERMIEEFRKNDDIADAAEVCIILTNDNGIELVTDFNTVDYIEPFKLICAGKANLENAILEGLERLEVRVLEYKETGTDYFQPWLITIASKDENQKLDMASKRIQEKILERRICSIPVVLEEQYMEYVKTLGKKGKVYILDNLKFEELFLWIGKSVENVSKSITNAMAVEIPTSTWESLLKG